MPSESRVRPGHRADFYGQGPGPVPAKVPTAVSTPASVATTVAVRSRLRSRERGVFMSFLSRVAPGAQAARLLRAILRPSFTAVNYYLTHVVCESGTGRATMRSNARARMS